MQLDGDEPVEQMIFYCPSLLAKVLTGLIHVVPRCAVDAPTSTASDTTPADAGADLLKGRAGDDALHSENRADIPSRKPGDDLLCVSDDRDLIRLVLSCPLVLAVAVSVWLPAHASAGEYLLERGVGETVCEAYRENLNSLRPNVPLGCGREASSAVPGFAVLKWQRLESATDDYLSVMHKIWSFLWGRDANPAYFHLGGTWRGTGDQRDEAYRQYLVEQRARFDIGNLIAMVDIDNDGKDEPLYFDRACAPDNALLVVLNEGLDGIDRQKTRLVTRCWRGYRSASFWGWARICRWPACRHAERSACRALWVRQSIRTASRRP